MVLKQRAASKLTKRVCHLAHSPVCCSALLGTVRRGNREPNTGCARAVPLAFNFSKLGAAAVHRNYLDSAFDQLFASVTKVQTLFQEYELLERTCLLQRHFWLSQYLYHSKTKNRFSTHPPTHTNLKANQPLQISASAPAAIKSIKLPLFSPPRPRPTHACVRKRRARPNKNSDFRQPD